MIYETKSGDKLKFEGHRNHADIQFVLAGKEFMDIAMDKDLEPDSPYFEESDATLFKAPRNSCSASVLLRPGRFLVVYPDDIHQPGRQVEEPSLVRKIVVKARMSA